MCSAGFWMHLKKMKENSGQDDLSSLCLKILMKFLEKAGKYCKELTVFSRFIDKQEIEGYNSRGLMFFLFVRSVNAYSGRGSVAIS